jgi:hypothetical protein
MKKNITAISICIFQIISVSAICQQTSGDNNSRMTSIDINEIAFFNQTEATVNSNFQTQFKSVENKSLPQIENLVNSQQINSLNSLIVSNPVNIINFSASWNNENEDLVNLVLEVTQNVNVKEYEVEKSIDGKTFTPVSTLTGHGINNELIAYNTQDDSPNKIQTTFYRLKQIDVNNLVTYSQITRVKPTKSNTITILYPNKNSNMVELNMSSSIGGEIIYEIIDSTGKLITSNYIKLLKGFNLLQFDVENYTSGSYSLKLINDKLQTSNYTIIIN